VSPWLELPNKYL